MELLSRKGILALVLLCLVAMLGHAQAVSPRTGAKPPTQQLSLEQFNRLPQEVQAIMKLHPDMYIIDQGPKAPEAPIDPQEKGRSTQEGPVAPPTGNAQPKLPAEVTPMNLPDHPQQQQP